MPEKSKRDIDLKFASLIKEKYYLFPQNEMEIGIENIQNWLLQSRAKGKSLKDILTFTVRTIYRIFDFKEVAIGLRSERDNLYRYEILFGYTKEAENQLRKFSYTFEELDSFEKFPGIMLSSITDFCFAEDRADHEGEELTYNRPLALLAERKAVDDFKEGDYLDISFFDRKLQLLGWLELSNTKTGKLPSRESLKWLEMFATIIGIIVERERLSEKVLRE